jgi:ankyrin repeat protein
MAGVICLLSPLTACEKQPTNQGAGQSDASDNSSSDGEKLAADEGTVVVNDNVFRETCRLFYQTELHRYAQLVTTPKRELFAQMRAAIAGLENMARLAPKTLPAETRDEVKALLADSIELFSFNEVQASQYVLHKDLGVAAKPMDMDKLETLLGRCAERITKWQGSGVNTEADADPAVKKASESYNQATMLHVAPAWFSIILDRAPQRDPYVRVLAYLLSVSDRRILIMHRRPQPEAARDYVFLTYRNWATSTLTTVRALPLDKFPDKTKREALRKLRDSLVAALEVDVDQPQRSIILSGSSSQTGEDKMREGRVLSAAAPALRSITTDEGALKDAGFGDVPVKSRLQMDDAITGSKSDTKDDGKSPKVPDESGGGARARITAAALLAKNEEYLAALLAFESARTLFLEAKMPEGAADCEMGMGEVLAKTGKSEEAIKHLEAALNAYEKLPGTEESRKVCRNRLQEERAGVELREGATLARAERFAEAIPHFRSALAQLQKVDSRAEIAGDCHMAMAFALAQLHKFKEANESYLAAYAIYKEIPGTQDKRKLCNAGNELLNRMLVDYFVDRPYEDSDKKRPSNAPAREVTRSKAGDSSPHAAADAGDVESLKKLVSSGAQVDMRNELGETLLHRAAMSGKSEAVEFLLDHSADVNATQGTGYDALHLAAMFGQLDVVQLLLKRGAEIDRPCGGTRWTALHAASMHGEPRVVEALLSAGADVNATDTVSRSALSWAAEEGDIDIVQLLLKGKADVRNTTENSKYTPLHFAAMKGNKAVVVLLLDAKAEINARNKSGETPLKLALSNDHKEVGEVLRDRGGTE